ncbi:MAG: cytochrome-c peroxidase [Actinomycetota bacterium]|nr:cytochrome-c peroxidase [Actinomycetota bacterium]
MKKLMLLVLLTFFLSQNLTALADGVLMEKARSMFKPIPQKVSRIRGKPLTQEKVRLGKALYFDPRLSASDLISCNTCHNVGMGGIDFQETSIGHRWQKGPRNAPTVFNSIFNIAQFWDGRAKDLKQQAQGPMQASVEMNNTPQNVVKTIKSMPGYIAIFKKAFPGEANPVTFENAAEAIEAFEATLITPNSPFDEYLKGNSKALTASQKEGLKLFIDKGCGRCHGGINMGGAGYYPFGLVESPPSEIMAGDAGRYKITRSKADQYVFKAPSLRNIALTPPYFHSGKVWDLKEAIKIMGAAQLGISLTSAQVDKIDDFLHATTGVQPKIEYPVLPAPTRETPQPRLD